MRILQVNKFHYPRGGADKYYLDLGLALSQAGHDVAYFSMQHPKNEPCEYEKYFVSRLSFNEGKIMDKLKAPGRIIYSLEAKRLFKKLLQDFKPDIIHIHNIYHQLSPSILDVARSFKIPVVMHLHDYKLICPNYQLFAHGQVCEACKPNKYWHCLQKKCFKDSFFKSALASLEMTLHHNIWQIYRKSITTFIAPSAFMKKKLVEFGWPEDKIQVIINPFSSALAQASPASFNLQDYFLYFGRLSPEKGLNTLLEAAALSSSRLKLAGEGPLLLDLKKIAQEKKISADFVGFKSGTELAQLILEAKAIVIPSIWYENMPLSMLEALSLGKPVIASRIGGLPEIIKSEKNGWLFDPQDIKGLSACLNMAQKSDSKKMRTACLESVSGFSPAKNLADVIVIYQQILKNK